ncbi:zinc transport system substrate-binding protein [Lachnotalea glycerini]|uniref:Zinc transport system substrate-binding protein n=2 Tax=Lachnotalea glycerini TaxID=1763509 RepID=A0A318EY70_9FIRM|nr:metal ABC transporter substrate-binding protein [Lachnotalea glycerini]PXV96207.1 zinc transport system substrate-binding protein [Lachnotalea glycerini]
MIKYVSKKMNKGYGLLIFLGVLLAMLGGCASNDKKQEDGKLKIYTSFYTMYDFTSKIAGDKAEVVNLVENGTEPHDWEPSTTDMTKLEEADMLVYNGAGMEHWIEQVTSSLENNIVLVEASNGVELISDELSQGNSDPHVWLDAKNAKIEMENIKNALVKIDEENAQYYESNYEKYATMFDELDSELTNRLGALKSKNIIVSHEAFSYLCKAYGLTQVSIGDLEADAEPDANRIAQIVEFAKTNQVKTIFFEELVSPKVANVIANEVGADTAVLNPVEGLTEDQMDAGEDYFSIMRSNMDALEKALN